jgi:two-component system sensor histidine kinase KdpD
VSHEFRTPLATIKAAATSLLSDQVPWDAAARHELLSAVDEETDYLNYLVGNLLDMSRIEAGALKPNRQWNDLSEIIEGVLARLYRTVDQYTVTRDIPDDLPLIPVDYIMMEQVFTNLIKNSAKYAPTGSLIQIAAMYDKETLTVKVINEGPQVAPDHLKRIFDKFYRVTEPEKVSGTGLACRFARGSLRCTRPDLGRKHAAGLSFIFTRLFLDGPTSDPEAESMSSSPHVLVIDDEPNPARPCTILTAHHYRPQRPHGRRRQLLAPPSARM